MNNDTKNKIDAIWETFWTSGITNPLTVIEQITYLLFIKILDDSQLKREANANAFDIKLTNRVFNIKSI